MKIGLVGVGHWGTNILNTLKRIPDIEIAICDLKDKLCSDYRKMPKLDACIIATPADTHYEIAGYMLSKGVNVFIEKPMTKSLKEAIVLNDMAKSRGLTIMVGHTYIYNGAARELKLNIKSGDLGKIYYINCRRLKLGKIRDDVDTLWNFAPHDISMCNWFLDSIPESVSCRSWDFITNKCDVAFLKLYYPDGTKTNIHVSWLDQNKVREITVVGDKGMVVFDDTLPQNKLLMVDKVNEILLDHANVEPLFAEMVAFIYYLRKGEKPESDGKSGEDVIRVLDAAEKSMHNNGEVCKLMI